MYLEEVPEKNVCQRKSKQDGERGRAMKCRCERAKERPTAYEYVYSSAVDGRSIGRSLDARI